MPASAEEYRIKSELITHLGVSSENSSYAASMVAGYRKVSCEFRAGDEFLADLGPDT